MIINQVYPPDPASVGQHVADAAEEMVTRGWSVRVLTSSRGYEDASKRYPANEIRNGVQVRRLPFSSFGKRSITRRLLGQTLFVVQALSKGVFGARPDLVLASTSPPFAGFVGAFVSLVRQVPLVWWVMDLNPDQIIATGGLSHNSLVARLFRWMNRVTVQRAAQVVTLDQYMARRLLAQVSLRVPRPKEIIVMPPWPHVDPSPALSSASSSFRMVHGLQDRFVVMYSGNHAIQHPLTTLLDAAKALRAEERLAFVFVGGGLGKRLVDDCIAAGETNIVSLPYQPLEGLVDSLSAADVHVVTMGDGVVGIVHPCKIYGALAIGRPILFFGPQESHVGEILATTDAGWVIAHGDVDAAVQAIRTAVDLPAPERMAMGTRATTLAAERFSRPVLRAAFCNVLESAAGLPEQRKKLQ